MWQDNYVNALIIYILQEHEIKDTATKQSQAHSNRVYFSFLNTVIPMAVGNQQSGEYCVNKVDGYTASVQVSAPLWKKLLIN